MKSNRGALDRPAGCRHEVLRLRRTVGRCVGLSAGCVGRRRAVWTIGLMRSENKLLSDPLTLLVAANHLGPKPTEPEAFMVWRQRRTRRPE